MAHTERAGDSRSLRLAASVWSLAKEVALRSAREFLDDHGPQFAAAISYYVLFSLFPLAILAVAVAGVVLRDDSVRDAVVDTIVANVPLSKEGSTELESLLQSVAGRPNAFSLLGLLGLVWSASAMMGTIRTALSRAWDAQPRSFVRGKLFDFTMLLGAGFLILLSIALSIGVRLAEQLSTQGADVLSMPGWAWTVVGTGLGVLAPFLISFATFTLAYRFVPSAPTRLANVWPAALLAAFAFEALKHGFVLYLDNFGRYDAVYGSIGVIVAFLFFVFLAANVLLFGAQVASEWPRVRRSLRETGREAARSRASF